MGTQRRLLLPLLALVAAMTLGACGQLDLEQPIDLVLSSDFNAEERDAIAQAAEMWNIEVGTQLGVTMDRRTARQPVAVFPSALACNYAAGVTTSSSRKDTEVGICELIRRDPSRFYEVAAHELGHVLGIDKHADDPMALMATGGDGCITDVDRQLFHEANPGFVGRGGCHVLRDMPLGWKAGVFGVMRGKQVILATRDGPRLRYGVANVEDGAVQESHALLEPLGNDFEHESKLVATTRGFVWTSMREQKLVVSDITLPGGKRSTWTLDFDRARRGRTVWWRGSLYLALWNVQAPGVLQLRQVDLGDKGRAQLREPFFTLPYPAAWSDGYWFALLTQGAQLFLLTRHRDVYKLHAFDARRRLVATHVLGLRGPRSQPPALLSSRFAWFDSASAIGGGWLYLIGQDDSSPVLVDGRWLGKVYFSSLQLSSGRVRYRELWLPTAEQGVVIGERLWFISGDRLQSLSPPLELGPSHPLTSGDCLGALTLFGRADGAFVVYGGWRGVRGMCIDTL